MRKNVSSLILTSTHNAVKCSHSPAEKREHRRMKFLICDWLYENKLDFYTEVVFRDNSRADILVSDWGVVIEVLSSESIKDFLKKSYPFPAIPVDVDSLHFKIYAMLDDINNTNGSGAEYYIKKLIGEE